MQPAAPIGSSGKRWTRLKRWLREMLYRLRIEGDTPARQAAAVALGMFIGCTPLLGFHLPLCILFARLLGLNRVKTYLAAHISTPVLLPFLLFSEIQMGRILRGARPLPIRPSRLRGSFELWHMRSWGDLLVGSVVVGVILAAVGGVFTFLILQRRRRLPEVEAMIERTSHRYVDVGLLHSEFVRGKLRHDPIYLWMLRRGALPRQGKLLDLGCGRGILAALVATSRSLEAEGFYPETWAPPPSLQWHGIEKSARTAEVARAALSGAATIETADLRRASLPEADCIVAFDVLHYLRPAEQEDLLARSAAALAPGGALYVREADRAAGWRFLAVRVSERLRAVLRGRWRQPFGYRRAAEWRELLRSLGLQTEIKPMGMGTPYANILIRAVRPAWNLPPVSGDSLPDPVSFTALPPVALPVSTREKESQVFRARRQPCES